MDGTISQSRVRARTKEEVERDKKEAEEWTDEALKAVKKKAQ
jgi:hypothetical protein